MRYSILAAAIVLIDQATKHWVRQALPVGGSRPLIPGVVHLTHVQNTGAAFGLLRGYTPLLIAVALLAVGLAFFYRKELAGGRPAFRAGYAMGLAGAIGNLVDRVFLGRVTDFIDLRVWPIFNLADTSIVLGAILVGWGILTGAGEPGPKGAEGE